MTMIFLFPPTGLPPMFENIQVVLIDFKWLELDWVTADFEFQETWKRKIQEISFHVRESVTVGITLQFLEEKSRCLVV